MVLCSGLGGRGGEHFIGTCNDICTGSDVGRNDLVLFASFLSLILLHISSNISFGVLIEPEGSTRVSKESSKHTCCVCICACIAMCVSMSMRACVYPGPRSASRPPCPPPLSRHAGGAFLVVLWCARMHVCEGRSVLVPKKRI